MSTLRSRNFIVVAGNIGVGKSTLVEKLCTYLGWEPFYEPVTQNPYLEDFYHQMAAWAFHSQVFFLTHRLRLHYQLSRHPSSVVQDRSVYEDAEIFARNLYLQGYLSPRDYATYRELYETVIQLLPPPDLVIYPARLGADPAQTDRTAGKGLRAADPCLLSGKPEPAL